MKNILWLCLVLISVKSFSQFEEPDNRILNEFIVMLKPSHSIDKLLSGLPSLKNKECLSPRLNIYLLERNSVSSPDDFLLTLRQNENVKLAQFNHKGVENRSLIPNDSFFGQQWNMLNTGQNGGTAGADIDATEAWDINNDNITAEGDTVVVAIVDGMFDIYHNDLNFFVNRNEIDSNGIDDDGDTYIDNVHGWNVGTHSDDVYDPNDPHSTHVAGIAGAIGNNARGVAGVCWGVKILPVNRYSNIESDVVHAYDYVLTQRLAYNNSFGSKGAFVVAVNSSFGVDNGKPVDYPIWCAMYDSMGAAGILNIGATANMNINIDVQHDIPTECPSKWLISVTNMLNTGVRNGGAAYGSVNIDVGAPGTNIYSTLPPSTYGYKDGTSMAAPHVTGAIAAMYSAACKGLIDAYYEHPDSISLLIKKYLLDGAQWNSSLNNRTTTGGTLNLYRAVRNLQNFNCDSCHFNIGIDKVPISCFGVNDGAMAVHVDSGSIFDYAVLWSNNISAPECLSMEPGFYSVMVKDTATNCRRFATAELHYPDTIIITVVNTIPADTTHPGNITVVASSGNEPLLYSLDGVNYQQTATFSIPSNGTYTVYVKNASGCVVQQTVVVNEAGELKDSDYELRIAPNPVNDEFTVYSLQFKEKKSVLEIYDAIGRKIYDSIPATANSKLQTPNWESGFYFLRYENITKKFVVLH